jgi:hypothetical protein
MKPHYWRTSFGSIDWVLPPLRANLRARKAVAAYPTAVDSRSDNIDLLGANLAQLLPFLKERR